MADNYSALYAIRTPGLQPGYDRRLISVQRLTADYLGGGEFELEPHVPTVVVDSKDEGRVAVLPMPAFETAGSQQERQREVMSHVHDTR